LQEKLEETEVKPEPAVVVSKPAVYNNNDNSSSNNNNNSKHKFNGRKGHGRQ
jgi:hypothetical protein